MNMLPHNVKELPFPNLIVCEGFSDAKFICALLKHKAVEECSVGCPSVAGGHGMGEGAIGKYLQAIQAVIKIKPQTLTRLLVISDADSDAAGKIKKISLFLEQANFHVPTRAFVMEGNPIKVGIFIVPGENRDGTLEHLLLEAALLKNPALQKCLDDFCLCTGNQIAKAGENAKAKMRVSALVASHCTSNPWSSAAGIWSEEGNPVPIDSASFDHISTFLDSFLAS